MRKFSLLIVFSLLSEIANASCNSQCAKPVSPNLPGYEKDIEAIMEDFRQKFTDARAKSAQIKAIPKPFIKVFISSSIPKSILSQLSEEANSRFPEQVVFVFRGIKGNDFRAFIEEVAYLSDSGFIIDPESFKKLAIDQVPTFVVGTEDSYDSFVGATTIEYVLRYIAENGENAKEYAEQLLSKL